jgi:glycosyltransferase involved in cell wall biosynthesis
MKGKAHAVPLVEIIIPVLMPSTFLEPLRKSLINIGILCRVNFVLDFASAQEQHSMEKVITPNPSERFFYGQFGSPGEARNRALRESEGKYVCFWDVDDKPESNALLEFAQLLDTHDADLGVSSWTFVNSPEKIKGPSPLSFLRYPGIWRVVFKRELIKDMSFSSLQWGEDQLFLVEALSRSPKLITTTRITYRYNQTVEGSQTSKQHFVTDLSKALKLEMVHLSKAEGFFRFIMTLTIYKQLITVFKLAGPRIAWEDFKLILTSEKKLPNISQSLKFLTIWKNKWP